MGKGERGLKGDLILLKDESMKLNKYNKMKYLLKAIPNSNSKTQNNTEDHLLTFSEISTRIPDRSKPGTMKKGNPYKIEYFKNHSNAVDLA